MISRNTVLAIALAYNSRFTDYVSFRTSRNRHYQIDSRRLYDFLYVNDFEAWLLNAFKAIPDSTDALKEYIMKLHTGESIIPNTQNWDWKQRQALGQRILKDLAECLIRARKTDPQFEEYGNKDRAAVDSMEKQLELNGYIYRDGIIWVPEESILEEAEEQGVLEGLMKSLNLSNIPIIKHHLDLSVTHYQEAHWDDSISNSRKVLEGILAQCADQFSKAQGSSLSTETLGRPGDVRKILEETGILGKKERETIAQVYGLLSETGGHPYIAERDQARLMRHLALTFSQFVLLRLEGALHEKT